MSTWVVYRDGEQIDATPEQVSLWLAEGAINNHTQVFIEGNLDWVSLGTVAGLLPTVRNSGAEKEKKQSAPSRTSKTDASVTASVASTAGASVGTRTPLKIPAAPSANYLGDFLNFRKMLTPVIIKVIFWLSVAGFVLTGLITMIGAFNARGVGVLLLFLSGLAWMILGPIIARIYCEILMVAFAINDSLADIRRALIEKK